MSAPPADLQFMIKICGVKCAQTALLAAKNGANLVGLVFADASPRAISPAAAKNIVSNLKQNADREGFEVPGIVGLVVDPSDELLSQIAGFVDWIQLHGSESPDRVRAIKTRFGKRVIKAIGVENSEDIHRASSFAGYADLVLLDARPPKGDRQTGGHGRAFDWALLEKNAVLPPFLLAGGLTPENVTAAIAAGSGHTGFAGVDVSSGVERSRGEKDDDLLCLFVQRAWAAYEAERRGRQQERQKHGRD